MKSKIYKYIPAVDILLQSHMSERSREKVRDGNIVIISLMFCAALRIGG
jgi:hypothetical protein